MCRTIEVEKKERKTDKRKWNEIISVTMGQHPLLHIIATFHSFQAKKRFAQTIVTAAIYSVHEISCRKKSPAVCGGKWKHLTLVRLIFVRYRAKTFCLSFFFLVCVYITIISAFLQLCHDNAPHFESKLINN